MASGAYLPWNVAVGSGEITLGTDTLKAALMNSSHVFDPDNDGWADVSANEISGTGYTAGGIALTGVSIVVDYTNDVTRVLCNPIEWTGATLTASHMVVYCDSHINNTLLCSIDFGGAQASTNGTFSVVAPTGLLIYQ